MLRPSICIISIFRIVTIKRLDIYSDVTYASVSDNIFMGLEPTLGVINACLPILQPAVSRFSGKMTLTWFNWKSASGTLGGQLMSKGVPFKPSA